MTRIRPPLAVLVAAALSLAGAAPASAIEKYFGHAAGTLGAPTAFSSTAGCLDRQTVVFPFIGADGVRSVFTELDVYDHCAGAPTLRHAGFSELSADQLTIAPDRTSGSLHATIPAVDGLAGDTPTDPISLDLQWTGTGRIHQTMTLFTDGWVNDFVIVNHDAEACRDATVAGSVVSAGSDYAAGATPEASLCLQTEGSLFLAVRHP